VSGFGDGHAQTVIILLHCCVRVAEMQAVGSHVRDNWSVQTCWSSKR